MLDRKKKSSLSLCRISIIRAIHGICLRMLPTIAGMLIGGTRAKNLKYGKIRENLR